MPRLRDLSWLVALSLCTLVLPANAKTSLSPSAALESAGAKVGAGWASFPRKPTDRIDFGEDRTLAPYLYVSGGDPRTDRLPLKETSADVHIAGVIAQAKVRQVFENDGKKPIEAIYVFPGSTRAAVHGMRMRIGDRTVEAKIEKKAEARAQYEQAKREGKRASLLEQNRPNVFTMNVANLMPGDRIEVELDYSELLLPEDGLYEFVYPSVVGPRFTGGSKETWANNPHLPAGKPEPYKFGIDVRLETGIPLKEVKSPSHEIRVKNPSPQSAVVELAKSGGGNKDFVLRYRLAGNEIETGLLLYEHEGEKFFLMMLEPPQRPKPKAIPNREYVFLLDVSGSMRGYPLNTAKQLMRKLLGQLRVDDYFNVAFFSGSSWMMSSEGSLPATDANIAAATALVDQRMGGGGTRLMDGLRTAYAAPRPHEGLSRSVIVVTDGYVMVESQAFKWVREHLDEANVFSFGIGTSVNRALIEGLARAGQGEPFIVFGPDKAAGVAERLGEYIREPVLSKISYSFDGFQAKEVAPMKLPDLMARRPLVLFGKYEGEASGTITVKGHTGEGPVTMKVKVDDFRAEAVNAPIRYLWARKWVSFMSDELIMANGHQELVDVITDLGLSYNLLTDYTSFVAVDSEVVNKGGEGEAVRQALPMPEGVSNAAVAQTKSLSVAPSSAMRRAPSRSRAAAEEMAMPSSPAPSMAPPPSPAPSLGTLGGGMASGRGGMAVKKESHASREREDALEGRGGAARFLVSKASPTGLSDPKPVVAALEKKLASLTAACGSKGTKVQLELTFGAGGKIVAVKVVGGDQALGQCLTAKLKGFTVAKATKGAKLVLGLMVIRV
ncbi:MAG: VIT domain-containing protein [Deltaproteobacteria bacterium]|nr:VIT domain-containing protein [Deltaproteobacteria bacterium]